MHIRRKESSQSSVCKMKTKGRILKSDHSGRILRVLPFQRPSGVRDLSVLSELNVGESGIVVGLDLPDSVQNHLMHMGFVPDAHVTALRRAPAGDPTVYGIDGMEIALRHETAESIRVRSVAAEDSEGEELPELIEAAQ
jgi:Fe2+ transport system protein FeoA